MNLSKYKRIILVGSGGSGKSWIAKQLADITGYKLIHLDCEYWQPNWTKTPKEEWVEKQKGFIKGRNGSSMETTTVQWNFGLLQLIW